MKILTLRSLAVAATFAMLAAADAAVAQTTAGPSAPQEPAAQTPAQQQERPASTNRREARPRRDLISQEEMAQSGATNLYEVVQRLRPQWLRGGGASNLGGGGTGIVVYQGTTPLGSLDALRQMAPGYAEALRYLDGPEASNTLPGLGSRRVAGAIVIVMPGGR